MKAAFFHDVRILMKNEEEVYSIAFDYTLWQRYLKIFDTLCVCTRKSDEIDVDTSKMSLSSGPRVSFHLNEAYKTPLQYFTGSKAIRLPIREVVQNADVCIIRLPSIIGFLAVRECIRQKKPWLCEVVTCCFDSFWHYGNLKGKLAAPIMFLLNRYYISKSQYTLYVTQQFLQKRYPCKGICAGISDVVIDRPPDEVLENRIRKIEARVPNDIKLGLIGSLDVNYKGHQTAFKAVKQLTLLGYRVTLECLGSGETQRWIHLAKKLGIEQAIVFKGTLPAGKPVLEWLDTIDIFIMPSLQEGLPRSMVEAMSRGCAIIGAHTGGIPELLEKEYIIAPKDATALCKKVEDFILDPKLCIAQAERNFNEAKKYSKDRLEAIRTDFYTAFREARSWEGNT